MASDSYIVLILLACVVASYVMCVRVMPLVRYQLNNMFSTPKENSSMFWEVSRVMPYITCLNFIGCITGAYIVFNYLLENNLLTASEDGSGIGIYAAIGVFTLPFVIFFLIKKKGMQMSTLMFVNRDKYKLADMQMQFYMAVQSVLMTLLAFLHVFYAFSINTSLIIGISAIIITEILAFYKEYRIFSKGNVRFSHFFLYLCTLETISFALLIGISAALTNTLEINI